MCGEQGGARGRGRCGCGCVWVGGQAGKVTEGGVAGGGGTAGGGVRVTRVATAPNDAPCSFPVGSCQR